MGCCSSRAAASDPNTAYIPNQPHATSVTPIAPHGQSPRGSTDTRASHHNRRHLPPSARFNEPLRPHIYVSKRTWTSSRLARERRDFFDTRVSGRPEAWELIKATVDLMRNGDLETAQTMIDAAGLTVPTGDMVEGVYDGSGAYYQLPEWVVADPVNLSTEEQSDEEGDDGKAAGLGTENAIGRKNEKGKGKAMSAQDGVTLKARLSDRATDIVLTVSRTDSVGSIIERIKEEAGTTARVRLAYLGRILPESKSLDNSGWKEGHVVNAMVFATS